VERTRILFVAMPQLLSHVLRETLARYPDIEVVGEQGDRKNLVSAARASLADVVVIALAEPDLPADCDALLDAIPGIRVLGVAADGGRAFLWELGPPVRVSLGDVSPQDIVDAMRRQHARRIM